MALDGRLKKKLFLLKSWGYDMTFVNCGWCDFQTARFGFVGWMVRYVFLYFSQFLVKIKYFEIRSINYVEYYEFGVKCLWKVLKLGS